MVATSSNPPVPNVVALVRSVTAVAKSEPALPPHLETYKATLATAMEDGIITKDEDSMLQTLRKSLNVSESEHATLLANLMDQ